MKIPKRPAFMMMMDLGKSTTFVVKHDDDVIGLPYPVRPLGRT